MNTEEGRCDLHNQCRPRCRGAEGVLTPKTKLMKRDKVTSRNSWYRTAEPMIAKHQLMPRAE
jgi:5-methylcytosine-specific restriction endonuclease McrA